MIWNLAISGATGGIAARNLLPARAALRATGELETTFGSLLLDILTGNSALSILSDEAEGSWRVVTAVLNAWSNELIPQREYKVGSDGPPRLPSSRPWQDAAS